MNHKKKSKNKKMKLVMENNSINERQVEKQILFPLFVCIASKYIISTEKNKTTRSFTYLHIHMQIPIFSINIKSFESYLH
jgi:hypothetical protein